MTNPPSWLDRLFESDPRVVGEEARLGAEEPPISPEEAADVAKAILSRRIAFATGRACARRALARLDVTSFHLRNGPDRAPRWPSGIVGSITHTGPAPGGYCAAVVGRAGEVAALGVDAERWERLAPSLWSRVMTQNELAWVESHRADERQIFATVIFSAKESFYKAQYPTSGRFLGFGEVEVTVEPAASTFEVRVLTAGASARGLARCRGRFLRQEEFVLTGVSVPRDAAIDAPEPTSDQPPPILRGSAARLASRGRPGPSTQAGVFDQDG